MSLSRHAAVALVLSLAGVLGTHQASAAEGAGSIALGEVAPPPESFGVEVDVLHDAAETAIRQLEGARSAQAPRVVVSVALTQAEVDPVSYTVNATVRDARTGNMLVIIEAGAEGSGSATSEVRSQVANAAVFGAIRRIPGALAAK